MSKFIFLFYFFYSAISISAQNVNTNALHFDGVDDYIELGGFFYANQTNLTIEAWIKWEGGPTPGRDEIVAWGSTTTTPNSAEFRLTDGKLIFGLAPNFHYVTGSLTIPFNTWTHVAIVKSNLLITLYVNGTQDVSSSLNRSHNSNDFNKFIIGALYHNGSIQSDTYFKGTIDEVRIWNVSRTASEISSYKDKQINGSMTGLVASYHFNQGTAGGTNSGVTTLTYDVGASSSYSGTLNNFALTGATSNWVSASFTLPVTWQSFTATKKSTAVELNWSTASEQNTKDFEVQYSTNTQDWSVLGSVTAAGNSSTTKDYNFTHNSPLKGSSYNYYRIKQNDLDGKFSYSKIVSIIYNEPGSDVMLYPNLVRDVITIFLAESQQLRLLNMAGATVWQGRLASGRNQLSVSHLPKGVYVLQTSKGPQQIIIQ